MHIKRDWARYLIWIGILIFIAVSVINAAHHGWQTGESQDIKHNASGQNESGSSNYGGSGSGSRSEILATLNPTMRSLFAQAAANGLRLGEPSKTAHCGVRGALPDPACTPGAVFPQATTSTICAAGYTASVRNVSAATKRKLYAAYGLAYPQPRDAFEADHLVPLELGGSNGNANLWPEAASPAPGFHEKDLVENYLNDEVCNGNIDLALAQAVDAYDWLYVYDSLTPAEITALKSEWMQN